MAAPKRSRCGEATIWAFVALVLGSSLGCSIAVSIAWLLIDIGKSTAVASVVASCLVVLALGLAIVEIVRHLDAPRRPAPGVESHRPAPTLWGSVPVAVVVVFLFSAAVMASASMPGSGMAQEVLGLRIFSYVSISAGVTTSLVIVSVHVINATGQWLYRLLAPTDADLAAEAAAERPPALDVTEVVRPAGAVSETPPSSVPSVPGRSAAAAGKGRAPPSVSPMRFRAFFAVPVPVMWAALGLFLVAGIYFGAVFAVVAPDSGTKSTASRIAEDLQLTLSVGGSLGLVIGFWSFFINMSAERKRSPAELRADEEALLAAQLRERQFHDAEESMDAPRHRLTSAGVSF